MQDNSRECHVRLSFVSIFWQLLRFRRVRDVIPCTRSRGGAYWTVRPVRMAVKSVLQDGESTRWQLPFLAHSVEFSLKLSDVATIFLPHGFLDLLVRCHWVNNDGFVYIYKKFQFVTHAQLVAFLCSMLLYADVQFVVAILIWCGCINSPTSKLIDAA